MTEAEPKPTGAPKGLRAQKVEAVRARIADAAMRLFLRDGFEETTIDAVAAESGVARRGVFRHFATKEDIVLAWASAAGPELVGFLDATGCQARPLDAAANAIRRHVEANRAAYPMALDVGRLIERTPALKARAHEKYLAWEELLSDAMVARGAEPMVSRMAAAMAVAGLRIAVREWIASDGRLPMTKLLDDAYRPVWDPGTDRQLAPDTNTDG